jgi:hypothetical protein
MQSRHMHRYSCEQLGVCQHRAHGCSADCQPDIMVAPPITEEQDSADQVAGLEAAGRLVVQIAVAVVFFAAGFAFALWAAKGHVL